jgi:hypothetical protein
MLTLVSGADMHYPVCNAFHTRGYYRLHGIPADQGVSLQRGQDGKLTHSLQDAAQFWSFPAYFESKLANVYFGQWLAAKEAAHKVIYC